MESLVWKILPLLAIVVIAGITDVRIIEAIFIYFFQLLYATVINSFLFFLTILLTGIMHLVWDIRQILKVKNHGYVQGLLPTLASVSLDDSYGVARSEVLAKAAR